MKCVSCISLIVILISISTNVYGDDKFYLYDFPPLYKFDDYDICLAQKQHKSTPVYAMVFGEIKPKHTSELWQKMKKHYKEFPIRYRRDRLFFGICIERCKQFKNLTENKYKLLDEDIIQNEITEQFSIYHKRPLDIKCRKEYHELIHNCLNQEFQQKYDLNLKTFIEYCEESKNIEQNEIEKSYKDPWEILLYLIVGVILILNILSSLYDRWLKLQQPEEKQTNDFYKIKPQENATKLLTSFSICRNYYRLIEPYYGDVSKDFSFLDGYRSVSMLCTLFAHVTISEFLHIANPQYFELIGKDENYFWLLNTTMNLETFFVISGLLLLLKCKHNVTPQTSWKKVFSEYIKLMATRFSRFFPTMVLLLLVNGTFLIRLQDGPFWRHTMEPARVLSREYGWRNLLMIQNFSHIKNGSVHVWYLAADFQLYALYLLIIMIVSKYPKYKKLIYSSMGILSFVIRFSISYLHKLKPCFILEPETSRYFFVHNNNIFDKIYIQFYTNLSGYLIGIICAEIYLKYTSKQEIREYISKHILSKVTFGLVPIIVFLISWTGAMLYIREPSIWSAIYDGIHRILWSIFICGLPLILMTCKCGGIFYEFYSLPIFRVLARLSFQVYMWQLIIIFLINGYHRQPYYVNTVHFFMQFLALYLGSHILSFFFTLFMEYPIAQVVALRTKKSDKIIKKS